jgi:hypothetical protein
MVWLREPREKVEILEYDDDTDTYCVYIPSLVTEWDDGLRMITPGEIENPTYDVQA